MMFDRTCIPIPSHGRQLCVLSIDPGIFEDYSVNTSAVIATVYKFLYTWELNRFAFKTRNYV